MINLVLERNAEKPEEEEVGAGAHEEEERTDPGVGEVLERQHTICNEDANTKGYTYY